LSADEKRPLRAKSGEIKCPLIQLQRATPKSERWGVDGEANLIGIVLAAVGVDRPDGVGQFPIRGPPNLRRIWFGPPSALIGKLTNAGRRYVP
jgi:hypothetical protein